eukprot:GSMAST32.ASY1.ANO1.2127.1 assembled CDS
MAIWNSIGVSITESFNIIRRDYKVTLFLVPVVTFVARKIYIKYTDIYVRPSQLKNFYSGRIVWITGASSGIGEEIAVALSKYGAKIVLSGRNENRLSLVSQKCQKVSSIKVGAKVVPFDLSAPQVALQKAAQAAAEAWNVPVDIVVMCGGISSRSAVENTEYVVDEKLFKVNFLSNVSIVKSVLPGMLQRKRGHFIVISSMQGLVSIPFRSNYAASKHVRFIFSNLFFSDRNVGVTIVCPSYVKTKLSLNALRGTGETHGIMDETTQLGMEASYVAKRTILAAMSKKSEIWICSWKELFGTLLSRASPELFSYIMLQRARKGWSVRK